MATTLEQLRVIIDGEIGPFKKKMKEATDTVKQAQGKIKQSTRGIQNAVKNQTNGIAAAFRRLAKLASLAYVGKKMLDLGMYSTQMALQVTAAMNQIKRQMGESSQSFLKWIERNANAMNMSIGDATKYGAVYSNLFSNFIKDSEKLSAYTGKMLQTSAIIAQGTGRTMTDVMERIRSGLLGNTEAIEDLGINVNVAMIESTEAFKRFANGQSWQQLDYNTQQQIRLLAILEQASAKYGNTLQQSVNGRISLFKSLLSDAALNIGNAMLPIINAMMPVLNSLAMALKNVTAKLAEFIALMFNKKATVKNGAVSELANGATSANKAVDGLGDALNGIDDSSGGTAKNLDDAAKSAKKATKELLGLAGFDEITLLKTKADDDGSSGGSGGSGGKGGGGGSGSPVDILPEIELTDMDNQFKSIFDGWGKTLEPLFGYLSKLSDLFKEGFDMSFRAESLERFSKALNGIWESLKYIFADGSVLEAAGRFGEKLAYALGQSVGSLSNITMGVAVFIAESLEKALNETKVDIKPWIIRQFNVQGEIVKSAGNIAQSVGQIFYDVFTSIKATDIGGHIIAGFQYAVMGASEFGAKLGRDFLGGFERIITGNQEKLTSVYIGILSAVEPVFGSLKNLIKNTFSSFNKMYDEHIKPFVDSFFEGLDKIINKVIEFWNVYLLPALSEIGKMLSDTIDNHIQPMVDNFIYLFGQIADTVSYLWKEELVPLYEWIVAYVLPVLLPIFQFFAESFIIAWNAIFDILSGFFEILGGILEFLNGVFSGDWSKAWEGLKTILEGIWILIVAVFQLAWELIVSFFKNAWDSIVRIFSPLGQWFIDRWNDIVYAFENAGAWFDKTFQIAYKAVQAAFAEIGKWFVEKYNDVTQAMGDIASWFKRKFDEAWANVKSAFSHVSGFFRGIYDDIVSWFSNIGGAIAGAVSGAFTSAMNGALATVENAVNGFISMINSAIGLINKIPGVSIGRIGYVNLPRLARGGIVDSPTVAMIGEAGKEVVMPLENTGFLQTMGRVVGGAVVNALGGGTSQNNNWPTGDIVINIGGREFGRFAIDEINKAQEEAGELLLNI